MWLSPPSPWIGSAMKAAMSCGCVGEGRDGPAPARLLGRDDLVQVVGAAGSVIAGTSIRGQSNFGKRSVLLGSVLVSDRV